MNNTLKSKDFVNTESLLQQAFDVCTELNNEISTYSAEAKRIQYFLDLMENHLQSRKDHPPKLIVFGTDFPMELAYSLTGELPYYAVGGSRVLQEYSDDFVPRDTDPVTRSALGELFANEGWKTASLVIVPCSSDAQRKAAFLLQSQGWNVITIWIPAVKSELSHKSFLSEMDHTIRAICRHIKRRYTVFSLNKSAVYFNQVRCSIRAFLDASLKNEPVFPGVFRMAVLDSFFMTRNPDEWCEKLDKLTAELNALPSEKKNCPHALIIGSPIIYPNYKIPQLLTSAGIEISGFVDSRTGIFEDDFGDEEKGLEALAHYYFEHDSSSAFVQNNSLISAIKSAISKNKPDGIIWHVLKGHIEYDFELNRCEKLFEEMDLPVIRLETDYQYQDVEQLRIRIEAFGELMTQKRRETNHE